ncbi:MAG: hypothetical protein AAF901_10350 [Bacteroidota bacterium]
MNLENWSLDEDGNAIPTYSTENDDVCIKEHIVTLTGTHTLGNITVHADDVKTLFQIKFNLMVKGK